MNAERSRPESVRLLPVPASMRPRPNERGKLERGEHRHRRRHASMRPRPNERGKCHSAARGGAVMTRFNEAAS